MVESQEPKKKPKYSLNPIQRKALINKIYPMLLIGSLIWLGGEYLFSYLFSGMDFSGLNLVIYIVIVVLEVSLFVVFFFTSRNNKTLLSLLIFVILCVLLGFLSLPIVIFTEFLPQVHMFVGLSVGANLIVNFMTIFLRDKYFQKGYIWVHVLLFLLGCAIVEITFLFVFNIHNFLLTVPISLAYILVNSLILIFWGVRTSNFIEEEKWIYALFRILFVLVVALAVAVVVVVIVLILIACAIASDGAFDLSGLGSGGGGWSRSKKKKQQPV